MTAQGNIVLWIVGLGYLLWIVNLTRRGKLYIGYAVVWVFWSLLGLVVITFQPLLNFLTAALGAVFPVSALTLMAFALLFAMQIYLLSQLSILSRRVSLIARYVALNDIEEPKKLE
jgi:hypothetical protein